MQIDLKLGLIDQLHQKKLARNGAHLFPYSFNLTDRKTGETHHIEGSVYAADERQANYFVDKISIREQDNLAKRNVKKRFGLELEQYERKRVSIPLTLLGLRNAKRNIRKGLNSGGIPISTYPKLVYQNVKDLLAEKERIKPSQPIKERIRSAAQKYLGFSIAAFVALSILVGRTIHLGDLINFQNYGLLILATFSGLCAYACRSSVIELTKQEQANEPAC